MPRAAVTDLYRIDDLLSPEEKAARELVAGFIDREYLPIVGKHFRNGTFPMEVVPTLAEMGVFGANLQGYGCAGMNAVSYGLICQELERGDSGLRSFASVQSSLVMYPIHAFGSEEQKERFLPAMAKGKLIGCFGLTEPDFGSNPGGMRTRARKDGDGYVLNGSKMWITNAPVADVAVVWAGTDDGIRGFAVPMETPGVTANEIRRKLSLRASSTGELVLDDVRLPDSARLPEAIGLKAPLSCLTEARYGIVWGSLGAARDCLQTALSYAGSREQFGRPIAGFQLTQAKLADAVVELQKGYLLALHLGRLADRGELRPAQVSVGKLNNVREALAIARTCRTILGANGISGEYPVLRHANNLESVLTYEGTSEIHQLVIGQKLTGISAFS